MHKNFIKFTLHSLTLVTALLISVPTNAVYGHGLGIDTISSINVQDKKISISVEMPSALDTINGSQITITTKDESVKENAKNVTLLIGLFHNNEMKFRNYFFAPDGTLAIKVKSSTDDHVSIQGKQDSILGAYYATDSEPIVISGPIFNSGGLYDFEITVRTIDSPTNIIEDIPTFRANLSIMDSQQHQISTSSGNQVTFGSRSYYDKIDNLQYDNQKRILTFEMPFDWDENQISHIPVVHEEIHFPKNFSEFFAPSYLGKVNGIELFKSSVTIDDYSNDKDRIVHVVLLQDHLKFLKNQMKKSGEPIPDKIVFSLETSNQIEFPLTAITRNEELQVDLSWDPINIQPDEPTKFVFTIRNAKTSEPLRNSSYDFVILQGATEIHRTTGNAQVGGGVEEYTFLKDQTGPTIIRFENLRDTQASTEFAIMVAPEFHTFLLVFVLSITTIILLSKKISILQRN